MKKISSLILFFCFALFGFSSIAWWDTGHELIAKIAENNLSPIALEKTNQYSKKLVTYPGNLKVSKETSTFIESSAWCDVIKNCKWKNKENKKANSMFHYFNPAISPNQKISVSKTEKAIKKLLASKRDLGKNNCYTALQSSIKTVVTKASSPAEKAVAFRFILHLVGDMHMPLHNAMPVIYGIDTHGGNGIVFEKNFSVPILQPSKQKVSEIKNLHALWDAAAGLYKQLPYYYTPKTQTAKQNDYIAKEARNIAGKVKNAKTVEARINDANLINWAIESNMMAAESISNKWIQYYRDSKGPKKQVIAKFKSSKIYLKSAQKVCSVQIYKAGMRLANLLNAIYDPQHANKRYVDYIKNIKANKNIPTLKKLFPKPITFRIQNKATNLR